MTNIGRLISPFCRVEWAGVNLSAYDSGQAPIQSVVFGVKVSLSKDGNAPKLSFNFTPSPIGFEIYSKLKSENIMDPITVTIGYDNPAGEPVEFAMKFRYSGTEFSSGLEMGVSVQAVGTIKGAWTDTRISYTMEEALTVDKMPDFIKAKCGEPCKDLQFKFVGQAKEIAAQRKHKGNQIQRTPHVILNDILKAEGMQISVNDSVMDGTIVIHYAEAMEGELKKDKPQSPPSKPTPGVRNIFMFGPGLLTTITRTQSFNLGQNATEGGSSQKTPISSQSESKNVIEKDSPPQTSAAMAANPSGTLGPANESSAQSAQVDGQNEQSKKARVAIAKMVTTKCKTDCIMVPYVVGIKPRDVLAIPSLAGSYLEDWVIDSVSYEQQNTGEVSISISGQRPYTGQENLLDPASVQSVLETARSLQSTQMWHQHYWTA